MHTSFQGGLVGYFTVQGVVMQNEGVGEKDEGKLIPQKDEQSHTHTYLRTLAAAAGGQ